MRIIKLLPIASALFLSLTGCALDPETKIPYVALEGQSSLVAASYTAVDNLLKNQNPSVNPIVLPNTNVSILVATLVNINELDNSSAFGRVVAEQMASRLAQLRVKVNEVKLRGSLFVDKQGELLLSRELKDISTKQNADFVMVGTYSIAGEVVYVSVKLVRADDSRISSAYNFSISKNKNISGLLANAKW